jgi:hypothetical protein
MISHEMNFRLASDTHSRNLRFVFLGFSFLPKKIDLSLGNCNARNGVMERQSKKMAFPFVQLTHLFIDSASDTRTDTAFGI